ncbi:MAG: hypothetical protein V8R80_00285 [Eubacterium sp.]
MLKRLIVCLGLISSICLNAVCVRANTITHSELNENIELDMYEKWIDEMDLPEADKEFLIQDNHFREVYEKYEEEGIEINDIDVEDVSEVNSMARGTSYTSTEKSYHIRMFSQPNQKHIIIINYILHTKK